MAPSTRAQRREDPATHRRLRQDREPLQREPARAQRALHALEHALVDWGLPEPRATEVQWRLHAGGQRLGKSGGLMCPTLWGGRPSPELTCGRGGEKNLPAPIVAALPQQTWRRPWPPRGPALLVTLWPPVEGRSPAPRRRWPWTWVRDDRVFTKAGPPLGRVGSGSSGPAQRGRLGSDGVRLIVVMGAGTRVMPVDGTVRRPDPRGPGRPCRDQLTWRPVMRDRTWTALPRLGLVGPAPLVVADRGWGDSTWRAHRAHPPPGTRVVEGPRPDVFPRPDGRRVTGQALVTRADWPGRDRLQRPGMRDARLPATNPTAGPVTVVIVKEPGEVCDDWRGPVTPRTAPCRLRAWRRRRGMAHACRPRKHLLAAEACQVHEAEADDGPLVWRWWAGLGLFDTARRRFTGGVTLAALGLSLKHHGRCLTSQDLE